VNKILVVDDHPLLISGISQVLQDLFPTAELLHAQDASQAQALAEAHFDIQYAILDYHLPDKNACQLIQNLRSLGCMMPIIVISGSEEIHIVHASLKSGANAFIPKTSGVELYRKCFQTLDQGRTFLPEDIRRSLEQYRNTTLIEVERISNTLTLRKKDILVLMKEGYSNQEISHTLDITLNTVKSHVSAIMSVFNVKNRTHCVAEAEQLGTLLN
jgi:DNA-binding NarL/FixJ family response regulator